MDRIPGNRNEGFANDNLFANSNTNFNPYDNLNIFQNGTEPTFDDASWGLNANQSRGQNAVPSWQQNANHLSTASTHAGYNAQSSPYGRPVNPSPVPFAPNQFTNFGGQQTYQYQQQPRYDPSLVAQAGPGQSFDVASTRYNSPVPNAQTITPQALQRNGQPSNLPFGANGYSANYGQPLANRPVQPPSINRPVDQKALIAAVPKGLPSGMFNIIDYGDLASVTNSERFGNYVNVGKDLLEWDCTRSAVPSYVARRSRNELRADAGDNASALAKIGKKSKVKNYPLLTSDVKSGTISGTTQNKRDPDSSSAEDSSSDDDSEYSESEDDEDSPLPAKRPDDPKAGVEYDTIKALWYSKRKVPSNETIKKSLAACWDLFKTIRDRWKIDVQAAKDAEQKGRTGELPLLQSRVKDQRDMIETAFKAALKYGHRDIIELLSENVSLIFLCYQFLLDRCQAEDVNGTLSRAILETMSHFTTCTTFRLDKTHFSKVIPRIQKKADAKTKFWINKILANAETADQAEAARAERKKSASEPVAGTKRPATAAPDGGVQKKVATVASKQNGTSSTGPKPNGPVKKPSTTLQPVKGDAAKPAPKVSNTPTTTKKATVAKPSGFFSSLQSAAKKPGTSNADKAASKAAATKSSSASVAPKPKFSFIETMASLSKPQEEKPVAKKEVKEVPPETPEERAKRIRKEQRKKLRVEFKKGDDLVQIKYFTHDPEEELNHDASQMRDISEKGGEGRALKGQAQPMDIDDEEDEALEEEQKLVDFQSPSLVDFSVVALDERERNYVPYGGGMKQPDSLEHGVREQYEANNLIVFYASREDIPANPREPTDPSNGEPGPPLKYFGQPEDKYPSRGQQKRAQRSGVYQGLPQPYGLMPTWAPPPPPPQTQAAAHPAPVSTGGMPDIAAILAQLQPQQQVSYAPPQPPMPAMAQPWTGVHAGAPQIPAGMDLNALLSSLNTAPQGYSAPDPTQMMSYAQPTQQQQTGADDGGLKGKKHPFYRTKPCKYWAMGQCIKGDKCCYMHE